MTAAASHMRAVLPPPTRRGLSRVEAAEYIGVGASKFDAMVTDGRMPKPKKIDGRRVWDVRKWCDDAGLPHCSVHGLRKAAAARLAELGCTEFEIMSITGHQTSKEVTRYTKAASQRVRAEAASAKIGGGRK